MMDRVMRAWWLLLMCWASPACAQQAESADAQPVRGVTISTHTSGRDWGTDDIVPTLREIRDTGANWVAIHPYAWIRANGEVEARDLSLDDPPAHVVRPIREAHALGLKILIKPHLGYWGSPFSWRGEIEFDRDEEWARFWRDYRRWIVTLAKMCADADGFVVGTELDRTLSHEDRWRELIAEVRSVSGAPLTYAANWTHYRVVPFWDALDVIGIQAYFPLTEQSEPSADVLAQAWRDRMTDLRGYAQDQGRDIVFTELGYNRSFLAPSRPWESQTDGPEAMPLQLECMRTALAAVEAEPAVIGSFLWKWFTWPNRRGGNFRVDTPEMRRLLGEQWK